MVIKCRWYTTKHIPLFPSKHHENLTNALKKFVYVQEWSLCFLKLFAGKRCSGLVFCPDLRSLGQGIFSKAKEDSSSVITEQLAPFPINHDDNTVK